MNKEEIKLKVVSEIDIISKNRFEDFELTTEGSLTDTYKYMSLNNVNFVLEKCFELTYELTKKYSRSIQ